MDLTYEQKTLLWTIHYLNELRDKGLMEGGVTVSEDGQRHIAELLAEGFRPMEKDWHSALQFLTSEPPADAHITIASNPKPK